MAGTWGDLNTVSNAPGGIFQKMTTPKTIPSPGGTPTPNPYAQFKDPSSYRTQLSMDRTDPHSAMVDPVDSPLKDMSRYLTRNDIFTPWKTSDGGFDEVQFNSFNSVNGVPLYRKNLESGDWEINPDGRMGELNRQFPGLFSMSRRGDSYEDGRPDFQLDWDNSMLPKDRFGSQGLSVDPIGYEDGRNGNLRNPDLVYDDPFYGRITHRRNLQQHEDWFDKFNDMLGPILMSVAGMGLGGALGGASLLGGGFSPSTIMSLGQGARGAMNGNIGSLLSSIASMGLGPLTGLSGMPLNLARSGTNMAISQLTRPRGGGRG